MRIAIVGLKGIHFDGGIENVVRSVATRLASRGHYVTVFGRSKYSEEREFSCYLKAKNTFSIETKRLGQISQTLTSLLKLAMSDFDIIHIHSFVNGSLSWIPRCAGKKTILTIHNFEWNINKWSYFDKKILRTFIFFAKWFPNAITSASIEEVQWLSARVKRSVNYIPHGVDLVPKRSISTISEYGLQQDGYILYVGRITYSKGLEYLITAYNRIKTDKPLVIVGYQYHADNYAKMILDLAQNNPNILFVGYQEREKLNAFYSNAYFIVQPSESESNSLVTLEALSFGNCLLASNIPGIRNIAKENAYYFETKNVESLKDKIELLVNNFSLVEEKRKNSSEFVKTNYDWNKITGQYECLYKQILESSR